MIFSNEAKYEILLSILLDNAYLSILKDRLIFDNLKLTEDIGNFLREFEPDKYKARYEELR